ncbi:MAG: stage III sporulation protein AB [Ruminococcaceae bacterium]|nr:stage III sporulation protein AB [Oscillospiraceae bacterium]
MDNRYMRLIRYLPEKLKRAALAAYAPQLEELRLRSGRPLTAVYAGSEQPLDVMVAAEDISYLASAAAHGSVYAAVDSLKNGYITVDGGNRIGFCGTAVLKNGEVTNLRNLSSANMRLAREIKTAAENIERNYNDRFESTLIIAPPGMGKTTLLRDLVRRISDKGIRTALVDERGEIAAMENGVPGFDTGMSTDVITGCPKAQGMLMMLRAMNPEVIAVDEITAPEDVAAVETCRNCAVGIIATVHGQNMADIEARPLFKKLLDTGTFGLVGTISGKDRRVRVERRYG